MWLKLIKMNLLINVFFWLLYKPKNKATMSKKSLKKVGRLTNLIKDITIEYDNNL